MHAANNLNQIFKSQQHAHQQYRQYGPSVCCHGYGVGLLSFPDLFCVDVNFAASPCLIFFIACFVTQVCEVSDFLIFNTIMLIRVSPEPDEADSSCSTRYMFVKHQPRDPEAAETEVTYRGQLP